MPMNENIQGLLFGPVAEQYLILRKRFQSLDEELHLLRQLIHFQSTLSHPEFLAKHGETYGLDDPFALKVTGTSNPQDDRFGREGKLGLRGAADEPSPYLFESLLEVALLQAQEVEILSQRLREDHEAFVEKVAALDVRANDAKIKLIHSCIEELKHLSRAYEAAIEAVHRTQNYFIQRSEETSPSSLSIPRVFKRDNEKTISLIERTYRAYRGTARAFVKYVLSDGDPRSPAPLPREDRIESAVAFEFERFDRLIGRYPHPVARVIRMARKARAASP